MSFSYWELKNWFTNVDFTIVGSGIVGLTAALQLRERFPESKIIILEKGILPQGASTKNAGFACFGSLSELIDDFKNQPDQEVIDLVQKRWMGLHLLRKNLSIADLDFKPYGGYELFLENETELLSDCMDKMSFVNERLKSIFNKNVYQLTTNPFGFKKIQKYMIYNSFEGQIDTGKMMNGLLKKANRKSIFILNGAELKRHTDLSYRVEVEVNDFSFFTKKLLFATNGFAGTITNNKVKPARAQVLITESIDFLHIKGTFHIDKGYYYFRNIDNRILLGGGRNLDFEGETTTEFGETELIQKQLEKLLKEVILPDNKVKVAHRWSGIMGLGETKTPIVKQLSTNVYCGVRLGGMGVALGSLIGQELADLIN